MRGIGVDIEIVERFRKRPYEKNRKFYKRIFTEKEIKYCLRKRDPYPHFTGRFAAKEAFIKAVNSIDGLYFKDIEVLNSESGKPYLKLKKQSKVSPSSIFLSISHTEFHAISFVIITD